MASDVTVGFGTSPEMASMRLSDDLISASAGVVVGIVRYLCRKNTVLQVCMLLVVLT